jgi:spectrin beta
LKGSQIYFYKDQKTYRSHPEETFKSEPAVDLLNSTAEVAADYTKKKHVFRLR